MTIYDIAREAGVSASTVSRVVNNKPGIKASTRERVMEIVKKYNFAPDETARGLVNQATKIIGLLVADVRITNYMMGIHGVIKEMAQMGYCCIVLDTGLSGEERAEYIKILSQRRVEGAMLIGAGYACEEVEYAISTYLKDVPVVMVNGFLDLPNVYCVMADERRGMEICFDTLFEKGFKKPAYIYCSSAASHSERAAGIADSTGTHAPGMQVPMYRSDEPFECGYGETRRVLEEHPDTDVVVYSSDSFARRGMQALQEMDISVPGQLSIVSAENSPLATIAHPYITAVDTKMEIVCDIARGNLVELLAGKEVPHRVMVTPKMAEGETLRG